MFSDATPGSLANDQQSLQISKGPLRFARAYSRRDRSTPRCSYARTCNVRARPRLARRRRSDPSLPGQPTGRVRVRSQLGGNGSVARLRSVPPTPHGRASVGRRNRAAASDRLREESAEVDAPAALAAPHPRCRRSLRRPPATHRRLPGLRLRPRLVDVVVRLLRPAETNSKPDRPSQSRASDGLVPPPALTVRKTCHMPGTFFRVCRDFATRGRVRKKRA
jgi:hypothetical protein